MDSSIQALILQYGLPVVALMLFAGELGVPTLIPMEIALLIAGAYAINSPVQLVAALALMTVADLAGTTILHYVARIGGNHLLGHLLRHHEPRHRAMVERWRRRLGGHDVVVAFVGRMLPLVRMYVSIGLGLLRIPIRHFLLGAAPAALVWAGTPLALGYVFRTNVQVFEARYVTVSHVLMLVLPAVSLVSAVVWWVRSVPGLSSRIGRVRIALGLIAVTASVAYVAKLLWAQERASDRGLILLPLPVLLAGLVLLGGLVAALIWQMFTDLDRAHIRGSAGRRAERGARAEVVATLLWAGLICLTGVAIFGIEWRYPAL